MSEQRQWSEEFSDAMIDILLRIAPSVPPSVFAALHDQIVALVRERTVEAQTEAGRLRGAMILARAQLAKGRPLWNGPCHQCDAVLSDALSNKPQQKTGEAGRDAAIEEVLRLYMSGKA